MIPRKDEFFFHFNYFSRGNETDGKEQQQQTKRLLSNRLTLFDFLSRNGKTRSHSNVQGGFKIENTSMSDRSRAIVAADSP